MLNSNNNRYSYLYNTTMYIPPSVIRKIEEATPGRGESFNKVNVNRGNSIESITNQSSMEDFFNIILRNRDIYSDMKNKIIYSISPGIANHANLNQL